MAVDLSDFVNALKREVEPPGTNIFTATNSEWIGYLSDAFWEARLDGFLTGFSLDEAGGGGSVSYELTDGTDSPTMTDAERQAAALVIIYAGVKVLRNRILNMNTQFRAKAGPVEFEQQNSATMLAEMLKQLKATKDRLLAAVDTGHSEVLILDGYSTRMFSSPSYYGAPELSGGY